MPQVHRSVPTKAKLHGKMHHITPASVLEPMAAFPKFFPGTKVCGIMGPATHDVDTLVDMLNAGMTSARVDLTWGPPEYHKRSLRMLMEACKRTKRLCGVMVDTLGREIYVKRKFELDENGWPFSGEAMHFQKGEILTLTTRDTEAEHNLLPITYEGLPEMCEPGDQVFIGRYLCTGAESASCYARVLEVQGTEIVCELESEAVLKGLLTLFHIERSSDVVINKQNQLPILPQSDLDAIACIGEEFEIDWLCLSFTRCAADVIQARKALDEMGMKGTKILAKIETRQSLLEFRHILKYADGIILSRGNMGLDIPPEKMCLVQKTIISACNMVGKPAFITRVVDTMANTPRPTRAEATDVANAVLDGVDGILLGAETLRGLYPVDTVRTVVSITIQGEKNFDNQAHFEFLMEETLDDTSDEGLMHGDMQGPSAGSIPNRILVTEASVGSFSNLSRMGAHTGSGTSMSSMAGFPYAGHTALSKLEAICSSAVRAADKCAAKLIIVFTNSGRTAQLVAKYRPPMPILTMVIPTLSTDGLKWRLLGRAVARQCQAVRGVCPVLAAPFPNGEDVLREALGHAMTMEMVAMGDKVVCIQKMADELSLKILAVEDMVFPDEHPVRIGSANVVGMQQLPKDGNQSPTTSPFNDSCTGDKAPSSPFGHGSSWYSASFKTPTSQ
mmetsp:Transcript_1706/g.4345  ORF Transcript_1706/g.4345 Transcript_1706/m.4345 type:complete len:674 (+) Transcript_1706:198-2219(+)